MDLKKETLKGFKWNALGNYTATIVSFIIGVFLARLLEPSDYGTLGMVAIFFSIARIITDSGFASALIQKKDANDVDYSTVFYFNIAIALTCYIVLYVSSSSIAKFFNTPVLKDIVKISGLTLVIGSLGSIQDTIYRKSVNFKILAKIQVIVTICSGLFGLYLAWKGYGVWALVFPELLSSSCKTFLYWVSSSWRPQFVFSRESFYALFSFGSKLLITNILSRTFSDIQNLLIGKFYSPKDLGFYTKGHSTAQLPVNTLFNVLASVTYPIMSKIQDDDERLLRVYKKYIKMSSLVIFFAMVFLAAIARPLVIFLYSNKWEPSIIYLQLICFCSMFAHIGTININLMLVKGRSDKNLLCEIYRKLIWIIALSISLPISVLAVAIFAVFAAQGSLIVNTYFTKKYFNYGYKEQWIDFAPYLILSILTCTPAYFIAGTSIHPLISIIGGGILSMLLYFGFFYLKKDENFFDLIEVTPLKKYFHR